VQEVTHLHGQTLQISMNFIDRVNRRKIKNKLLPLTIDNINPATSHLHSTAKQRVSKDALSAEQEAVLAKRLEQRNLWEIYCQYYTHKGKAIITVFVHNVASGVGDLRHGLAITKDLQILFVKNPNITVQVFMLVCSSPNETARTLRKRVTNRLIKDVKAENVFVVYEDEVEENGAIIRDENTLHQYIRSQPQLLENLKNTSLLLEVPIKARYLSIVKEYAPKNTLVFSLGHYASMNAGKLYQPGHQVLVTTNLFYFDIMQVDSIAAMGINPVEAGIRIDERYRDLGIKSNKKASKLVQNLKDKVIKGVLQKLPLDNAILSFGYLKIRESCPAFIKVALSAFTKMKEQNKILFF